MTFLRLFYAPLKSWQSFVCLPSLKKSKKCVCGKNPVRTDLFVRFFCGFLETAGRLVVWRRPGARSFAVAATIRLQFRSDFVQQRQPIGIFWSLAQDAPAFSRFPPHRFALPRADARIAHTFFRFFPTPFV